MVRELERAGKAFLFPETAPAANPVFFRTYSRRTEEGRETWEEVCQRTVAGLLKLGNLTAEEADLLYRMQVQLKALASGRWLWVGGSEWIERPENFSGGYNCSSTNITDWPAFGLLMDLAMMGCGTGAVLEPQYISQLPVIRNPLSISLEGDIGTTSPQARREETEVKIEGNLVRIYVGDSRQGWVKSYQTLLELSTDERFTGPVQVVVNLDDVRPAGEPLKGFGGVANPVKLPELYQRCVALLNKAVGRQLNSVECCLLIDEAAVTIVAGNIRRSAGMRQFNSSDQLGAAAKDNLWQQDENGNWRIDPERDALRMSNHTRVFHRKPTLEETIEAVRKQYYSGEGAIQWAGEAIARANIDLLPNQEAKKQFLKAYEEGTIKEWFRAKYPNIPEQELGHRLARLGLNPCHTGDTLVSCDKGLVPIQDLVGKSFKALVDLRSIGLHGVKLTDAIAFATGVQKTYVVTLANGMQMRCTAEHKHYTHQGWVKTKDLTAQHSIFVQQGEGAFGEGTISVEEAQMLGWWYGDGYNVRIKARRENGGHGRTQDHFAKGFVFNPTEYELAYPVISSAIANITGVKYITNLHKGVYEFRTQSPHLENFFAQLNIYNKEILPESFLQQSKEVWIGFLQGIFCADGTVEKGVRRIKLVNKSPKLLQQLQLVLLQLGILSVVRCLRKPGYRGVVYKTADGVEKVSADNGSYGLCVLSVSLEKFHQLIGFPFSPAKSQKLQEFVQRPLPNYAETTLSRKFSSAVKSVVEYGEETVYDLHVPLTHSFIANGCITHNCGEIVGANFHCNLAEVHLNQIDPYNFKEQEDAFTAGALSVAVLLNHRFVEPRYQYSRELDPIVGVSFTGLFDFFVNAFGVDWLRWWSEGRPQTPQGIAFKQREQEYLTGWCDLVHRVVWDYCDRHGLKRPNRCTTVQPSGTKSLLSGASPGWHPPKAQRFIRRITFRKNDPVALACLDYGYSVIPSQSDKDENGNLLNDPFDPRCSEWLVEIPVAVPWADIPGADQIEISQFSALAQMDFYMQVQKFYVRHNTSATIELREAEVDALGTRIYEAIRDDEGYISAALLARFDDHQTFPRLPFEPISKESYEQLMQEVLMRRRTDNFHSALRRYDFGELLEAGPAGCDSDKCMMPEQQPSSNS